ncbi:helix-turn-helix transcriptional regulator [Alkalibacillus almallahensis]|uniref:helix-turn-helix transcriptional regulator n=1 Tax=Alkalibacillus almallahensis TaxID=1379154 RepID=UPI00141FFE7A|nr:helix-turn-helix transcriptional regulator [Alkalibacillus almallahensis]NIK11158.1 transcriptional regulator with XRE-family HTH domain [Alkalibacillus almallahensis]
MVRKLLLELRNEKDLTQQQLAENLDLSTVYVRKLEKGVVNPGRETMLKYESYFNRDMRELFPDLFFNHNDKKFIKEQEVS